LGASLTVRLLRATAHKASRAVSDFIY